MEGGGGVRIAKMKTVFHVVASELSLPRCRFHVVTRGKEHGSHVHEASVLARAFNFFSIYVRFSLYTPVYSR